MMRTRVLLTSALLTACSPAPDTSARADGPDPGVVCEGATLEEARVERHPMVLRGVVRAPPAPTSSLIPSWLVPEAAAFAFEFEAPAPGAAVQLVSTDRSGAPSGEPLRVTRTDGKGRFCLRVPDGHAMGQGLTLLASVPGGTLRHALVWRADASLDAQAEARYRVLERSGVDLTRLDPAAYLNWRTVADTRLGLLSGLDQERARSLDELIPELVAALEDGERVQRALEALEKRTPKNE